MYRVCIVCSGNICRSPMAEVILRSLLDQQGLAGEVGVDSAGTGAWHVGDGADARALAALQARGYDGSAHQAREFSADWFADRDLILAADRGHLRALRRLAPTPADAGKVRLLREFDPDAAAAGTLEVDDPWYGQAADFERCLREVEAACRGLAEFIRTSLREGGERPVHAG